MMNNLIAAKSIFIDASVSKVWDALTKPELIKQYLFGTDAKSDWKVGSPITFSGTWEGKPYVDKGTIIESIPNKIFKYDYWSSFSGTEDKKENYANVTYLLEEENKGTKLTITQDGIADHDRKTQCENNWGSVMENIKKLIE